MDEILFRLSSNLEALQIETASIAQQAYQLVFSWLTECQRMLQNVCSDQYSQHIKDLGSFTASLYHRAYDNIHFGYYSARINFRDFYRQLGGLQSSDVSKRDVAFCTIGLAIGIFIGYNVGLNWKQKVKRIHYMKAIICHHYAGVEGVSLIDDAEVPSIQRSNELLIQVKAASVNIVDAKICSGYSKAYRRILNSGQQKELPVVLGRDCAGIVVEIGQSVLGFDVGDEVFLAVPSWASGTMSEYLVVTENLVAKKPKLINFDASACLPYSGLICKLESAKVIKALGADDIIPSNDCDIYKELELHDKYHAIFYTEDHPIDYRGLKRQLMPYGSFVSTVPEHLASDSFGFVSGSLFAGCVRIKLLVQYVFGSNINQWNEGSKIKQSYLETLRELVDADQLQSVVCAAFRPNHIEQALQHVLDPDAIGSTIIKFR
ncbi:hypothetical protein G9C98_007122 [Cotesia typhae]|uniref:Enoyl reductase (ER) domain-containing protein n=1 Tax=Cotesia typhae TaxID=2053667 RepID=A0A8J5QXF6_9HYME|nr:hypothetical protein G9C98_007122 [Cotesia typhae]